MRNESEGKVAADSRRLDGQDWLAIVALTLLAALLRLPTLGHASLWFDELLTWRASNQASLGDLWTKGLASDNIFPPAYFIVTYIFMKLFGDGEAIVRLPAAIFGVLSVPAVYALGRRLFSRDTAILAAAVLTLSYTCIYYSQEARPYSMMMLLAAVTTYLWYGVYEKVIVDQRRAPWSQIAVLLSAQALFCYTHYMDVFVTGLQVAFFSALCLRARRGLYVAGWVAAGLIVLALPWLPEFRFQMGTHVYWLPFTDPLTAFTKSVAFLFSGLVSIGYFGAALMLLALFPGSLLIFRGEPSREYKAGIVLVGACAASFLIVEGITVALKPLYLDRYLAFCLPFAYVVIARQVDRIQVKTVFKAAITVAPLLLSLLSLEQADHSLSRPRRDDWRGVIASMARRSPAGSKVSVLSVTEQAGVAQYYFARTPGGYLAIAEAMDGDQLPKAWDSVMATRPDYIWLFHGQVSQPQTLAAANGALNRLQAISTKVDGFIDVDRNVGADLYKVDKN